MGRDWPTDYLDNNLDKQDVLADLLDTQASSEASPVLDNVEATRS